jgi:hypothetical protein
MPEATRLKAASRLTNTCNSTQTIIASPTKLPSRSHKGDCATADAITCHEIMMMMMMMIIIIQKAAILGTSHIIRKVLQAETWKSQRWGSPLAQEEKYQGRKRTCDKRT